MSITDVSTDTDAHTLTITAEFDAGPEQVWELWSDPRKLERWWGPPGYPATFGAHELVPDGRVAYFMTGPDGTRYGGWWRVREADPPHHLAFLDGFADDDGRPNADMPESDVTVDIVAIGDARTRMSLTARFASAEAMEKLIAMGMSEGIQQAMGQIPAILAEAA